MSRKEIPTFSSNQEVLRFWRTNSVSSNVCNGLGRYNLTREEAKTAYTSRRADVIELRASDTEHAYRAFKVRNEHEAHRESVRAATLAGNPWLHWGTQA